EIPRSAAPMGEAVLPVPPGLLQETSTPERKIELAPPRSPVVPMPGVERPGAVRPDRPARPVSIDLDSLAAQGYLTPGLADREMAEEFRVIKLQLLRNMDDAAARGLRRNLICVTSAVPAEGKTFFSMNLAMSLAMEVDYHALLVDADVLRPSVLQRYGLPLDKGLLELMTQQDLDVSDVLLRTNVPKLSLLPAGAPNPKSPELLSSAYVDTLLDELAHRYADRIVIFDAPPILVASGARHLASRVGQVVMVVGAGSTDAQSVNKAFAAVENCPLVSSVLNRCPTRTTSSYGYYEE
ncbi:MAG TPA: XrtA-associated tyrosine autokinase, partial [Burkholderiaceae bacterium]|nr:XrtA-associated tyrosine autokinase [Burkholderiaceae bacterium]